MYLLKHKLNTLHPYASKQKKDQKIGYPFFVNKFGNHLDLRNLWKAKPSALNMQSKGLYSHQFL